MMALLALTSRTVRAAPQVRGLGLGLWLGLLAPLAAAGDFTCVRTDPARHVLHFRGGIADKEAARFQAAVRDCFPPAYGGQRVFDLHSGGGSVVEALRIANEVVSAGESGQPVLTRVSRSNYCISACTYLFVAGRFREMDNGASLEPHGFSSFRSTRLDLAIEEAVDQGRLDPARLDIAAQRLSVIAQVMAPLIEEDRRLDWLGAQLQTYAAARSRSEASLAFANAFRALPETQRNLLARLDSITTVVMTELQRVAALAAFEPLMAGTARSAGGIPPLPAAEAERLQRWMGLSVLQAVNSYLKAAHPGDRTLGSLEAASEAIATLQRREAQQSTTVVSQLLWPYLARRSDVMDVPGFVRLMFSTSIIYTRPLSRDELCDFNLVNIGCE